MSGGSLLPRQHGEFRSKEYWQDFFTKRTEAFEWYGSYTDVAPIVRPITQSQDRILVVGCGNSNFSADLYDDGYHNVINIDFSELVIQDMARKNVQRRDMQWQVMDMTYMDGIAGSTCNVVVDKGALDALMSEDTNQIRDSAKRMLDEIRRVLKVGGRYICISLCQDFILGFLLSNMTAWDLSLYTPDTPYSTSPYLVFVVIATKRSSTLEEEHSCPVTAQVYFDNLGKPDVSATKPYFLQGDDNIRRYVQAAQWAHRRRAQLRQHQPGRFEQEDLWTSSSDDVPKYTLLVVDVLKLTAADQPCAVVLIPRGRETEFAFASQEGLCQLAASIPAGRIIAVRMNRGHEFPDVEAVKAELSPVLVDFTPADSTGRSVDGTPILAVAESLGSRGRVVAEGVLGCSGPYTVEEVDADEEGAVWRRLIFMQNQGVIQTEVQLLPASSAANVRKARRQSTKKKGKGSKRPPSAGGKGGGGGAEAADDPDPDRLVPCPGYLCFDYHTCMVGTMALADVGPQAGASALVVGLGGGALPMALRTFFPHLSITVVELDSEVVQLARQWFGFEDVGRVRVVVEDGIKFIQQCSEHSEHSARAPGSAPGHSNDMSVTGPPPHTGSSSTAASATHPVPLGPDQTQLPFQLEAAFLPPYSAIFIDVDSKDPSVGMTCPPEAFTEDAFLDACKSLLREDGMLSINVSARNKSLYMAVLERVSAVFSGGNGEVYQVQASEQDVNMVVTALGKRRAARAGPLRAAVAKTLDGVCQPKMMDEMLDMVDRMTKVQLVSSEDHKQPASSKAQRRSRKR